MALTDNLEHFWKFDESSGTRNDTIGTLHLTVGNDEPAVCTDRSAEGKIGICADWWNQFTSGSDSKKGLYWKTANHTCLGYQASFSVNLWIRRPNLNLAIYGKCLITQYTSYAGSTHAWYLLYDGAANNDRKLTFATAVGSAAVHQLSTSSAVLLNPAWYMITITYNNSDKNKIIYCNGTKVAEGTASHTADLGDSGSYPIMSSMSNDYNYATVGNARTACSYQQMGIWTRVLTQAEITQLYNNSAGLAYPFFDGKSLQFRS